MKKFFFCFLSLFFFLFLFVTPSFADTEFTVSNPHVDNGSFVIDLYLPNPPDNDNLCSWFPWYHQAFIIDSQGNRWHDFASCSNNGNGNYTISSPAFPYTGTYTIEAVGNWVEPYYDIFSLNSFYWDNPAPNFPPSLQLSDSPQPLPDVPDLGQVSVNLGQTYSVNGSFTDADSTSWTATVDYGDGNGVESLPLNGYNFSLNHAYNLGGTYIMTIKVKDEQGNEVNIKRAVSILDYSLTASNPRVVNGDFFVDLHGFPPDNLCSWFPAFRHNAYIVDSLGNRNHDFANCQSHGNGDYTISGTPIPANGTYKIEISESEQPPYPYDTVTNSFSWTAVHAPITLTPVADSYIKQGSKNENEGSSTFLRLQQSGKNLAIIKFDQSQIQQAVGTSQNYTATLQLTISDNGDNWGKNGRAIDIHRLLKNWTEGNGFIEDNNPANRGTGSGVTWNCAIDTNIANKNNDCSGSTAWNMDNSNLWPFAHAVTASANITNNQNGTVTFNVASDVQSFINGTNQNYGWLIKKTDEGATGRVQFGSKESTNSPKLIITKN